MENSDKEPNDAESFIEEWFRETRGDENLSTEVLDLVDDHRSGNEVKEAALLQALVERADTQISENNGPTN